MYKLSFGTIAIVTPDIIEVTFDEGVDIDLGMVHDFWNFVDEKMNKQASIILNKAASYSYQFDALMALSESDRIKSVGVVSYDEMSANASDYMRKAFNKSGKNVEIFNSKALALHWLKEIDSNE